MPQTEKFKKQAKKSAIYTIPKVTLKRDPDRIVFAIAKKERQIPLEEIDSFLEQSDEQLIAVFNKQFEVSIDATRTRNAVRKLLPETINITKKAKIMPRIVSKKPLIWQIELYVNNDLKLRRRVENYWWSKDKKLISEITNSVKPQATPKERKKNQAAVQEALAKWGKQTEKISLETLLAKYGYTQRLTSEPVAIPLDEIYHHVGEKVKVEGRVLSIIKGVEDLEDGSKPVKSILIYIDNLEGSGANIPVSYLPSMSERDPDGIIEVEGITEAEESSGKSRFRLPLMVMIRAEKIKRTNLNVEEYDPPAEDLAEFQKYFGQINNENALDVTDQTVAPYVTGRIIEKMFAVLDWLSPMELPLRGGVIFLLTTMFVGDARTSKDLIAEDLAENLSPIAILINAEMAKQTGLIGACDKDPLTGAWIIKWGKLVLADRLGAVLQGISSYSQENLTQLREILAKRKAQITKVVSGERTCRCRLLMTANCRHDVKSYKTRLQAAIDAGSRFNRLFSEKPDWLRVHVPVVFCEDDVSLEAIDESISTGNIKRLIPARVFKKKVADSWRRRLKDYNVKPIIVREGKKALAYFRKVYPNVPIAMLKAEGLYIFLSHVIALATYRNSLDEQNRVMPKVSDVEFVKKLWDNLFIKLGLDIELKRMIQEQEKAQKIADILLHPEPPIDSYTITALATCLEIVRLLYSSNKPLRKEDLSEELQISEVTIWKHLSRSQEYLDDSVPETPKLVESVPHVGLILTSFGRVVAKLLK